MYLLSMRFMNSVQALGQKVQLAVATAHRLQRADRGKHVIAVRTGFAVAVANEAQLLRQAELSGILRVAAIDHVAHRRDAGLGMADEDHRSHAFENDLPANNERLEFLGDAVLGIVVTDMAFREFPDMPEGELAKLRAAIVNMGALADVARDLGLGRFVLLGRGEEMSGGRDKSSILADALEEAGCTSPDVLEHCRIRSPHYRGCWVVDLILSKDR